MEKTCDLRDFDCGMIIGARQGGFSISEAVDLLGCLGLQEINVVFGKCINISPKT